MPKPKKAATKKSPDRFRYLHPGSLFLKEQPELRAGPPFNFENVTSRVFPIKANMARLTRFCNQYLNTDADAAEEHLEFRPALPYVYLMVINYGSMSPGAINAQNLGWVAQREVTFTVPLEQWEKENGRLVFKKWACVSPFIFVDDELSLTTGREVYGWPKAYAQMETLPTLWSQDPRLDSRLFIMKTDMTFMPYAGQRERPLVLMEIDLAPRPTYSEFPPSPKNLWSPISIFSTAAEGSLRLIEDVADMLFGLPIRGYRSDRDPATLLRMTGTLGKNFVSLLPSYLWPVNVGRSSLTRGDCASECFVNNITLKQFRDAEEPHKACYQAIVSSSMGINRLNACGLLGDLYLLRGDPSGGFTIRLYRYTAQPIIETLGLEIDRFEDGGASGDAFRSLDLRSNAPVAIIKPTFPFWTDVDLKYGKGDILCTRSDSQPARFHRKGKPAWINISNPQAQTPRQTPPKKNDREGRRLARSPELPDYNMVQGVAVQTVTGPFRFPDVVLQVYPLLADSEQLKTYIDAYLNTPLRNSSIQSPTGEAMKLTFEPFGSYAYMVVKSCQQQLGTMWSETNNIGWWADKDVAFYVPVKVYQQRRNGRQLISLAVIAPFAYANSGRAVITDREVNGRNAAKAVITCPPDAWLGPRGPASCRKMLELQTQVFPALNVGQKSEMRTLIELEALEDPQIDTSHLLVHTLDRIAGERWGKVLEYESERVRRISQTDECQRARALALELMTTQNAFNVIYLKQYRDAVDPNVFCYQAYVNSVRQVQSVVEIQDIYDPVTIRLHKYPDHDIRKALGLKCQRMDSKGDSVVFVLEPQRPFWLRLQLNEELSRVLCSRTNRDGTSNDGVWKTDHPWFRDQNPREFVPTNERNEPYFRGNARTATGPKIWDAIRHSFKGDSNEDSLWASTTQASSEAWLRTGLEEELESMSLRRLRAEKARLSNKTRTELENAHWRLEVLAEAKSTEELYWFVEELHYALQTKGPGLKKRNPHRRFTRQEARSAIDRLEDVKALIDLLLYEGAKARDS
jgi:hypothetical protein